MTARAEAIPCARCGALLVTRRDVIGIIVAARAHAKKASKTCGCGQVHELDSIGKAGTIVAQPVLL